VDQQRICVTRLPRQLIKVKSQKNQLNSTAYSIFLPDFLV
jgi:hypothetical protein